MNDPGDENDWREPPPVIHAPGSISALIEEGIADGTIAQFDYAVFEFMNYAECMRDCCLNCAQEINGEDGS